MCVQTYLKSAAFVFRPHVDSQAFLQYMCIMMRIKHLEKQQKPEGFSVEAMLSGAQSMYLSSMP